MKSSHTEHCECSADIIYLSAVSPKDKPWDKHKAEADKVRDLYRGTILDKFAGRIDSCSGYLEFGWSTNPKTNLLEFRLQSARFCRVRHCPVCQWRRSLMWVARFLKALPAIQEAYPKHRWVFLTLTVRNCQVTELRATLAAMNKAWKRMTERQQWPADGFARATEVTRGTDGTAHPHFHCLLLVPSGYFAGKNYMSQAEWSELWRESLRVEYTPIVHVKAVRARKPEADDIGGTAAISSAIAETFKYAVKPSDLIGNGGEKDAEWLIELTSQLHKTRAIALGGVLKQFLSEEEPEDLIGEKEDEKEVSKESIYFGWREREKHYSLVE